MTELERELLEACKAALEASESGVIYQQVEGGDSSRRAAKLIAKMEAQLRAAIAKATA